MITLFTTPRPFEGLYQIIQTNALKSWSILDPAPERVLVFADREHEGDIAVDFVESLGFEVLPILQRSPHGVPLLSDLFPRAQEVAGGGIACYVNADILLQNDLVPALEKCSKLVRGAAERDGWEHSNSGALMVARRWNVQVLDYMDFSEGWEGEIGEKVDSQGSLMAKCAMDLFAWYGTVWKEFKPFAIGRFRWDNWLVGMARHAGVPVIDVSHVIRLTHQAHSTVQWLDPDAQTNFGIAGKFGGLEYSTYTMTEEGLVGGWLG